MHYGQKMIFSALLLFLSMNLNASGSTETAALSTHYLERVPARFGHGFMNAVFGWTALGVAPFQAHAEGAGGGDAFGRAITHPFAYTFLGIWDLATFWVPGECGRGMAVPRHVWMAREKISLPQTVANQPPVESSEDLPAAAAS